MYDRNTVVQLLERARFELISDSPLCTRGWLLYTILDQSDDYDLITAEFDELQGICDQLTDERRTANDLENWGYVIANHPVFLDAVKFLEDSDLDAEAKRWELTFISKGEHYNGC